jgi:hypothetical protein
MIQGIEIPNDFTFEMELDEECPCGCKEYEPSQIELVKGMKPMRIEVCIKCKSARMNRSVWHKNRDRK